tara:strand:- start:87 stop:329 length:243 start_codon:yes stop_codon:yes gene_type:complete
MNYYDDIRRILKLLRNKIYKKQKVLLNFMYENNIGFNDKTIKIFINEINLLEEIYDIKKYYFDYDSKNLKFNHLFHTQKL